MNNEVSEFRFGEDIEVNTDDEEIIVQHFRVKKIENLEKCTNLKNLTIVASCVSRLESLTTNVNLVHLEVYQGLLRKIENISHLRSLLVLDLSFNEIGKIEGISDLVLLEKLYLSNNHITRIEGLETLRNLKVLELGSNRIRKIENIENLSNLEELWLGKNKINELNNICGVFPNLKQLSLQSNRLTIWPPVDFFNEKIPNLQSLYLGSNQLPNPDQNTLEGLIHIQELDLSCNMMTEIPNFQTTTLIEELWMNDNLIPDTFTFNRIGKYFPKLKTLYMERNPVQTECPLDYRTQALANAPPTLQQLDACLVSAERVVNTKANENVKGILKHT